MDKVLAALLHDVGKMYNFFVVRREDNSLKDRAMRNWSSFRMENNEYDINHGIYSMQDMLDNLVDDKLVYIFPASNHHKPQRSRTQKIQDLIGVNYNQEIEQLTNFVSVVDKIASSSVRGKDRTGRSSGNSGNKVRSISMWLSRGIQNKEKARINNNKLVDAHIPSKNIWGLLNDVEDKDYYSEEYLWFLWNFKKIAENYTQDQRDVESMGVSLWSHSQITAILLSCIEEVQDVGDVEKTTPPKLVMVHYPALQSMFHLPDASYWKNLNGRNLMLSYITHKLCLELLREENLPASNILSSWSTGAFLLLPGNYNSFEKAYNKVVSELNTYPSFMIPAVSEAATKWGKINNNLTFLNATKAFQKLNNGEAKTYYKIDKPQFTLYECQDSVCKTSKCICDEVHSLHKKYRKGDDVFYIAEKDGVIQQTSKGWPWIDRECGEPEEDPFNINRSMAVVTVNMPGVENILKGEHDSGNTDVVKSLEVLHEIRHMLNYLGDQITPVRMVDLSYYKRCYVTTVENALDMVMNYLEWVADFINVIPEGDKFRIGVGNVKELFNTYLKTMVNMDVVRQGHPIRLVMEKEPVQGVGSFINGESLNKDAKELHKEIKKLPKEEIESIYQVARGLKDKDEITVKRCLAYNINREQKEERKPYQHLNKWLQRHGKHCIPNTLLITSILREVEE